MSKFWNWIPSALWTKQLKERWWLDRYPGDCIVSLNRKRRFPLFNDQFIEWQNRCQAKGFGPHSERDFTTVWAEILFQEISNKFDPLDQRLAEKSDATLLAECQRDQRDLPCFQFWELDGDVVEIRLKRVGFRFVGDGWVRFEDTNRLLIEGIPLSYNEMRSRVPFEKISTNEANFLSSFHR
jgi:hypothetical protein